MTSFVVIIDPSPRAIARRLRELGREFRSWRSAWRQVLPYLVRGVEENFASQGARNGAPWPALKPGTLRRKARMGQNRGALIGTGENVAAPLHGGGAVTMTATKLRYGISSKVANIQQHGSKRGLPPRRFMDWNRQMEAATTAALDAYARQLIGVASAKIDGDARGGSL